MTRELSSSEKRQAGQNQNGPSTAIWNGGIYGQLQPLGRRDRQDECYLRD